MRGPMHMAGPHTVSRHSPRCATQAVSLKCKRERPPCLLLRSQIFATLILLTAKQDRWILLRIVLEVLQVGVWACTP